eukprot:2061159-Rhodomonas_salina.1
MNPLAKGCGVIKEREAQEVEIKPAKQTVSTTTYPLDLPVPLLPTFPLPAPSLASVPGEEYLVVLRVPVVGPVGRQAPRSYSPAEGHGQLESTPKHVGVPRLMMLGIYSRV